MLATLREIMLQSEGQYLFLVPPQILPFDFGDEVANSGDLTTVQCAISKGDYPIKFMWLHNERKINKTAGIAITQMNKKISTLTIDPIDGIHRGNYTCVAANKAGTSRVSAVLNINGIQKSCMFIFCNISKTYVQLQNLSSSSPDFAVRFWR